MTTNAHAGEDKTAIVTGASRGIGRAIAVRLAADGYIVGVHYARNERAAADVVAAIEADGGRAFAFPTALESPTAGTDFWRAHDIAAEAAGFQDAPIHALVNNAGVTLPGTIEALGQEDFLTQQAINVNAPYFIVKAGLHRLRDGGRIVNLSSGVTRAALPDIIGYALTKGAVDTFTLTLAKHLGPRGITVNAVAPGAIDTDMNASWLRGNPEAVENVRRNTALGRVGEPEDVAGVVRFLVSDDARWVTGQVLDATGGIQL